MNDKQRKSKEGGGYSTSYIPNDGEMEIQKFFTKEENDSFANGLELMGVKSIVKAAYNPAMRQWNRYHNDKPE